MRHRKVFFFVSVFLFIVAQFVGSPQRTRHGERGSHAVPSVTAATKPAETVSGIRIVTFSRDSITLKVTAPNIRLDPVTVDGIRYERLSAEGAESFGEMGAPDVPVFRWLLAVPDCGSIDVGVDVRDVAEYSDILVHPVGEERSLPFSEAGGVEVRFVRNDSIYRGSEEFPKDIARIRSIGYLRGQRLALLEFCPVRFHAKQQRLRVLKDVVLAVHYRDAEGEVIKNVGPMQSALAHAAINYDVAGGPSAVQGAGSPRMTGGSGQVCWCEGSDYEAVAASASACGADYLIIVTDSLVANAPQRALVDSLADHRKNTNGFNVAIACVSQLTDPPDTLDTPVQIRNLIKAVYDDSSAAHMGDGRLGYVLLLGDAFDPERNVLIPSYYGWASKWWELDAATDAYYSLLDSNPTVDPFPDVFLGRLRVDDDPLNWELTNVVSNILAYEPLPADANWLDKILMVSGGDLMYFTFQSELTFANFFDYIDANYIPGDKQVRKMHVIEELKEGVVSSDSAFSASVVDTLRKGYWAFGLFDHGNYFYLRGWNPGGCFLPIHYDTLGAPALPFVVAIGSHLGEFDFTADKQGDSIVKAST